MSDYRNFPKSKQLPFCKTDGEVVYKVLHSQGYKIDDSWKLIGRVTKSELKKGIYDFFRTKVEPKDTLLFYFSEDGIPDSYCAHYLASTDIEASLPERHGFRLGDLEYQLKRVMRRK